MPATSGQGIIVQFQDDAATPAYQTVAGLRSRGIEFNAEVVDVTNADSTGMWRELLTMGNGGAGGIRTAKISGSGVLQDSTAEEAVRDAFFENERRLMKITIPTFGVFDGLFLVTALTMNGEYNGAVMYDMTFESAGAISFTAL